MLLGLGMEGETRVLSRKGFGIMGHDAQGRVKGQGTCRETRIVILLPALTLFS